MKNIYSCPVSKALSIIGGKWSLLIIFQIGNEIRRFGELKKIIPTISEKMLIQELKRLAEANMIKRKAYKEIPPKVEYSLTTRGKKLLPIINEISKLGQELMIDENEKPLISD